MHPMAVWPGWRWRWLAGLLLAVLGLMTIPWPEARSQQYLSGVTAAQCAARGGQFEAMGTLGTSSANRGNCFVPAALPQARQPSSTNRQAAPGMGAAGLPMFMIPPGGFGSGGESHSEQGQGIRRQLQESRDGMDMTPPPAQIAAANIGRCVAEADAALIFVRANALTCGARAEDLNNIDHNSPALRYRPGDCARPLRVQSQRQSFEECGRVYYCAGLSLNCVKETARRERRCSVEISEGCLRAFPVPQ
jgi:hypothetical protein